MRDLERERGRVDTLRWALEDKLAEAKASEEVARAYRIRLAFARQLIDEHVMPILRELERNGSPEGREARRQLERQVREPVDEESIRSDVLREENRP